MKLRGLAIAVLALSISSSGVLAQEVPPQPTGLEACEAVIIDPVVVANRLMAFEDAFGKNALNWMQSDYDQLFDLVDACDGVQIGNKIISSAVWRNTIENARVKIYTLVEVHKQVMEKARRPGSNDIAMPECLALAKYTETSDIAVDNAEEVFGVSFLAMTNDDLRNVVDHANNCTAFLPEFLLMKYGTPKEPTMKVLHAIMDRALIMRAHREDWNFWQGRAATDIKLEIDGVEIIPTLAEHETQRMIKRYNQGAKYPNGLSTQTIALLVSMADKILENKSSGRIDVAFAEKIKELVQRDIFSRSEYKLEPNAAE